MEVPSGEWIRFELTAGLGTRADGTWSLTVTLPGAEPRTWRDLPCAAGWKSVEWLGFVSNSTEAKAFYIDDLAVTRQP